MNKVRLGDVAVIMNGSTPDTTRGDYYGGEIPWATPKDLSENKEKYFYGGSRSITKAGAKSISESPIPANSLLLTSRAPIGLLAINKFPSYTNQGFKNIVPSDNALDVEYLYYYLKQNVVALMNLGSGTTFKEISKSTLENLLIYLPEIEIQRNVAYILALIDSKIQLNNQINAELEAIAKLIYDYWFVQFDFPDQNGKPYKTSGGKMVWNEELKREIPEGWETNNLKSFVNIFDSQRIPLSKRQRELRTGEYPYYGATGLMDYIDDYIFDGQYLLLAEDGSVMDANGFPNLQYISGKFWVNNHAHILQAKDVKNNEYLFRTIKFIPVVKMMTGSVQMKVNQENLLKTEILIPSQKYLEKYSTICMPYRDMIFSNELQNTKLSKLRDWLLPMLMNGQVKVRE